AHRGAAGAGLPDPPALHRARPDRRRGQGVRVVTADRGGVTAHHDGSATHVSTCAPAFGERVTLFVRTAGVTAVHLRTVVDGEPRYAAATVDRTGADGLTWWRVDLEVRHRVTGYRFLLECPDGPRWL